MVTLTYCVLILYYVKCSRFIVLLKFICNLNICCNFFTNDCVYKNVHFRRVVNLELSKFKAFVDYFLEEKTWKEIHDFFPTWSKFFLTTTTATTTTEAIMSQQKHLKWLSSIKTEHFLICTEIFRMLYTI